MAKQPITHKSAQRIAELVLLLQCGIDDRQLLIDHIAASLERHDVSLFEVVRAGMYALSGLEMADREAANAPCDWLTTSNWYNYVEDLRELELPWFEKTLLNLLAQRPSLSLSEMQELDALVNTHLPTDEPDFGGNHNERQRTKQPADSPAASENKQMPLPI